jgi:hypothetical protein
VVTVLTIGWPPFTTCLAESGRLKQKVNKRARIFAQLFFTHFSTRVNPQHLVISQNQQVSDADLEVLRIQMAINRTPEQPTALWKTTGTLITPAAPLIFIWMKFPATTISGWGGLESH